MIYLHKLLPLLVMPIFMCCVLLVYALIRRRRWPIAIAIALALTVTLALVMTLAVRLGSSTAATVRGRRRLD